MDARTPPHHSLLFPCRNRYLKFGSPTHALVFHDLFFSMKGSLAILFFIATSAASTSAAKVEMQVYAESQ